MNGLWICSVWVRLGELDTRTNLCSDGQTICSEPQDLEIESIVHHPSYDLPKYANDIALIRLRRPYNSSESFFLFWRAEK